MEKQDVWLSIPEYSQFKKVSVSSIRRYIKSGSVQHKTISGKYYIKAKMVMGLSPDTYEEKYYDLLAQHECIETKYKKLQEQNDELKMLVTIYENQNKTH